MASIFDDPSHNYFISSVVVNQVLMQLSHCIKTNISCCMFHVGFLSGLFFKPEDFLPKRRLTFNVPHSTISSQIYLLYIYTLSVQLSDAEVLGHSFSVYCDTVGQGERKISVTPSMLFVALCDAALNSNTIQSTATVERPYYRFCIHF
jgi:hypothetical protein